MIRVSRRSRLRWPLAGAALALTVVLVPLVGGRLAAGSPTAAGVAPNPVSNMDCNGWSTTYKALKPDMRAAVHRSHPDQERQGVALRRQRVVRGPRRAVGQVHLDGRRAAATP